MHHGTKPPNTAFTDLYYTTSTHTGNRNLQSEESEAFETGIKYTHPVVSGSLAVFHMKGRNMIDWVKSSPDALWESRNHTRLNKIGLEGYLKLDLAAWLGENQPLRAFTTGYAYIHQERVEDNLISNYALNHLRHKHHAVSITRWWKVSPLVAFPLAVA